MDRDGLGADEQLAPDLAVAPALGDQRQDLGSRGVSVRRGSAAVAARRRRPRAGVSRGTAPSRRAVSAAASVTRRAPSASPVAASSLGELGAGDGQLEGRGVGLEAGRRPRARRRAARPGRAGRCRRPSASAAARPRAAPPRRGSRDPTTPGSRHGGRAPSGRRRPDPRPPRRRRARSAALRCPAPVANAATTVAASRTRAWNSGCQIPVSVSTIRRYVAYAAAWSPACSWSASSADPPAIATRPSCRQNGCRPRARSSGRRVAAGDQDLGPRGGEQRGVDGGHDLALMSSTRRDSSHRALELQRDAVHPARLRGVGHPGRALRAGPRRGPLERLRRPR